MMSVRPLTRLLAHLLAIFTIAVTLISTRAGAQNHTSSVVTTPQVRAELLAHAPDGVGPGKTVWLGLQLTHQPQWHTYWKNSGDSGLPTTLQWTLPAGLAAGEIAWPLPHKIPIGNLANYGYEDTVLLPVPLTLGPDFKPPALASEIEIRLQASWLVCRRECIPEEGSFALKLPLRGSTALHSAAFTAAMAAAPRPLMGPTGGILPEPGARLDGQSLVLTVASLPAALRGKPLELFIETPEIIETAATPAQSWAGAVWTARVPLSAQRSSSPDRLPWLLVATQDGSRVGYQLTTSVAGSWPVAAPNAAAAAASSASLSPALQANAARVAAAPQTSLSLWAALAGALLGGLLLNLMPCVFPVLAIKLLGFASQGQNRRAQRNSGLAYSAGVLTSFVALGALMLALRGAGEQLGWGFQLQSPAVVAALALLFTLLGLNLAGLFEFGQFLPSRISTLEARHPALNSALSGLLAVAVASPCTAPFMGASLGLALGLPSWQALLVFAAMGTGMALPFLAASLSPGLARKMPRPGPWMNTLRQALAFPMFATVVWLVWVLGQQSGIDGAAALLALLLVVSLLLWALGRSGAGRVSLVWLATALLCAMLWALGPLMLKSLPPASVLAERAGAAQTEPGQWQAWTPQLAQQTLAQGRPVFIDFTAAWCVTCQYNKQTTLANAQVLADLQARQVLLLRADWTRRDPAITQALAELGRSGVPVYALYAPGKPPQLLPEVLSAAALKAALAAL